MATDNGTPAPDALAALEAAAASALAEYQCDRAVLLPGETPRAIMVPGEPGPKTRRCNKLAMGRDPLTCERLCDEHAARPLLLTTNAMVTVRAQDVLALIERLRRAEADLDEAVLEGWAP